MKDKYGFDFYEDLINHDYDNVKSIGGRITMLIDEVIRLKNNKNDVIEFYKQNTHRLIKNQKIISEIKNNHDDYEFFKSLMS
jgi:ABC-type transporter Mla maintaining outer membrane lipid asymmetry ATPase subunit MlaF